MSAVRTSDSLSKLGDRYYLTRKHSRDGFVFTIIVGDGETADEARESCDMREARAPALRALRSAAEFDHKHGLEMAEKVAA